jgi:hypothetical protein
MNEKLVESLVDLYGSRELTPETEEALETLAFNNAQLSHNMSTLRRTVDVLRSDPGPELSEESYQRILMKIYARGAEIEPNLAAPIHLQYQLPIQG